MNKLANTIIIVIFSAMLLGCGGGGGGDTGIGGGGGGGIGGLSSGICVDGTNALNPDVLTVGKPCTGDIAFFADNEFQFTATATGEYTISLTNTQSDLSWELSVNSSFNNFVCDRLINVPGDEICSTAERAGFSLTGGDSYFLLVRDWGLPDGSANGSTFTVLVVPD